MLRRTIDFVTYESIYTTPSSVAIYAIVGTSTSTPADNRLFFWSAGTMFYREDYNDGVAWT